jgi:hypothetical protein
MLTKVAATFGKPALLQAYPLIGRYLRRISRNPPVRQVLGEMAPTWAFQQAA